jgi:hypothetical protein
MVTLQAFTGTTALTALMLSATIAQRDETYRQIEWVSLQLAEVIRRLSPDEERLPPEQLPDRKPPTVLPDHRAGGSPDAAPGHPAGPPADD